MEIKIIVFKGPGTIMANIEEHEDFYLIKKPVEIVVRQSEEEGFYVAFLPFLHFCVENATGIEIPKSEVLCVTTPVDELLDRYSTAYTNTIENE